MLTHTGWLIVKHGGICEYNACVCSHHFIEQDFVSGAIEGFGPKRPTLKPEAVPTVFCFSQLTMRRKLIEAREAKAMHHSIIDNSLVGPSSSHGSSEDPQPATGDIGIQCG